MLREVLISKIHRAKVTDTNINYCGSITIDRKLMESVGILKNEKVHVWDIDNGERVTTYAIPGKEGEITINGGAARLIKKGDRIIITTFGLMTEQEFKSHKPRIVILDESNKVIEWR